MAFAALFPGLASARKVGLACSATHDLVLTIATTKGFVLQAGAFARRIVTATNASTGAVQTIVVAMVIVFRALATAQVITSVKHAMSLQAMVK